MDKKEHKASYIKWIALFILLYAIIIAGGVWASQRDAEQEAERKYEFNIIQSIIENLAVYQDEIESWGYSVSVPTSEEEPEDESLQRYYRNHCSYPILILTDADGGMYCFYYGFDGYTSVVSYQAMVKRTSGEEEEALLTVRLELHKRNLYQAPLLENLNEVGVNAYYDVKVELDVDAVSVDGGKEIWASSESGHYFTNYCSNNLVDCMHFGLGVVDPEEISRSADLKIKQKYSAAGPTEKVV